jgi:hypothetical protein
VHKTVGRKANLRSLPIPELTHEEPVFDVHEIRCECTLFETYSCNSRTGWKLWGPGVPMGNTKGKARAIVSISVNRPSTHTIPLSPVRLEVINYLADALEV